MEKHFLPALLLTIGLETAVLFSALKLFVKREGCSPVQVLFAGVFASTATLPYLWFILPIYMRSKHYLWVGEFGVVLVEALIFKQILNLNFIEALLISLLCNFVSYFAGGLLMARIYG